MMQIGSIRAGHVTVIILALLIIWWNTAHGGPVVLTPLNVAFIAISLIMLWRSRSL